MRSNHSWQRAPLYALAALALLATLGVLAQPAPLRAQSSPGAGTYTLDWWTVDGGGQSGPAGAGYTLEGTIGQPDAALWQGGTYTLAGGFWHQPGTGTEYPYQIFLPLVMR